jgi:hypothetical protein
VKDANTQNMSKTQMQIFARKTKTTKTGLVNINRTGDKMLEQIEKLMLDKIMSDERSSGPFAGMILNNVVSKSESFLVTDEKIESAIKLALRVKIVAKRLLD